MSARPVPALAIVLIAALTGCATQPAPAATIAVPGLLAPGDRVEVTVHTAPELSRELIVGSDGLVSFPLAGPVMAMARTPAELAMALRAALASELIDPDLDVVTTGFASPKVFIGGEVRTPGVFNLPEGITPLAAITMAGGLTQDALPAEALLIRRLPGGEISAARIDIRSGPKAAFAPLRRFDVLYVPASPIADQQNPLAHDEIREALPRPFQLFYDIDP